MRNVLFVAPFSFETTGRFITAAAEKLRQELLVAPEEAVDAWITEEDELDYLVAWVCLVAEEVHRPLGGDEGLRSAWLAVRIADALLDRHRQRESEPAEPGRKKLPASVLTDLLALAWARFANALRIVGEIASANNAMRSARTVADAFELNPWVEAEVSSRRFS